LDLLAPHPLSAAEGWGTERVVKRGTHIQVAVPLSLEYSRAVEERGPVELPLALPKERPEVHLLEVFIVCKRVCQVLFRHHLVGYAVR